MMFEKVVELEQINGLGLGLFNLPHTIELEVT